ncbi:hypothetical protein HC891_00010 [Candidatus Gracilibacteria bacterium]|nr:hypothetical protein [Candidatus Gracilibacteria bacterium]
MSIIGRRPPSVNFNPAGSFNVVIGGYNSNRGANGLPHAVRFWAARDRNGQLIPNSYIVAMDNVRSTFDAGANYDYQDNVYLVTNIRPTDTTQDPNIPGVLPARLAWCSNSIAIPTPAPSLTATTRRWASPIRSAMSTIFVTRRTRRSSPTTRTCSTGTLPVRARGPCRQPSAPTSTRCRTIWSTVSACPSTDAARPGGSAPVGWGRSIILTSAARASAFYSAPTTIITCVGASVLRAPASRRSSASCASSTAALPRSVAGLTSPIRAVWAPSTCSFSVIRARQARSRLPHRRRHYRQNQ